MAKATTSVTSAYLLQGAVLALEQCGHLLHDANWVYRSDSYATAVVLAAFAREELGRAGILFDLRAKVVAGGTVTWKKSIAAVQITSRSKTGLY
jgi:AbiV family abortive infection protein